VLARYVNDGWLLFAHAWRPAVATGALSLDDVRGEFERIREQLGLPIEIVCCPHDAGPPVCWCRKPIPGSILEFALRHAVALSQSILVGNAAADRTLAQRLGIPHASVEGFFTP
jgi:histidinol phosphatase-like enzyme